MNDDATSDNMRILLGKYIFLTIPELEVIAAGPLFRLLIMNVKGNNPDDI
jgi:hypothetical protein